MFERDVNLPEREWTELLDWLAAHRLVFHNAKFDLHHLRNGTRHWEGRSDLVYYVEWDTMLAAREIEPTDPIALKSIGSRYGLLGGGEDDEAKQIATWLKRNKHPKGRYDLVPWEIMEKYAAKDTELTLALYLRQLEQFELGLGRLDLFQHEMKVMKTLYWMEERGISFDAATCLEAADKLEVAQKEIEQTQPFAPTIPAAKTFFFERQGVLPYEMTDKGNVKLTEQVLEKMVKDDIEWAQEFADWRSSTLHCRCGTAPIRR